MFFRILIIFFLSIKFSFSQIVYDKNNIIINNIELKEYMNIYNDYYNEKISKNEALKKIILQKKLISNLYLNNPQFMEILDNNLKLNFSSNDFQNLTKMDFYRFLKIRNEFISDYFINEFSLSDLKLIINSFNDLILPISLNNCLTIDSLLDLKNNDFFINSFYENIKDNTKNFKVKFDSKVYDVCVNEKFYALVENEIISFINDKTLRDFNNFIYGKK